MRSLIKGFLRRRFDNRFFEVCVNVGNHAVRLKEINLDFVASDRDLFENIWDSYSKERGILRRIFLKPCDVHFVMVGAAKTRTSVLFIDIFSLVLSCKGNIRPGGYSREAKRVPSAR
jgi:hypothetical protein